MKIGEAHRTQSSSLYSANTIGAPMYPAPIGVADRTGKKKFCAGDIGAPIYWRTEAPLRQYIGAPMSLAPSINIIILNRQSLKFLKRGGPNISVRLTYFQDNHLLTGHYKQETEILLRKDDGNIKK
jgi:hypothetical protein